MFGAPTVAELEDPDYVAGRRTTSDAGPLGRDRPQP